MYFSHFHLKIMFMKDVSASIKVITKAKLTHWVNSSGHRGLELGQHCLRYLLAAGQHQVITWINVDLLSVMASDSRLMANLPVPSTD